MFDERNQDQKERKKLKFSEMNYGIPKCKDNRMSAEEFVDYHPTYEQIEFQDGEMMKIMYVKIMNEEEVSRFSGNSK